MVFLGFSALSAAADEVVQSYRDYESFVDSKIKNREFFNVINRLEGADEFTPQKMEVLQGQLYGLVPNHLTNTDVVKRVELGHAQEMRAECNGKNSYLFFRALLHEQMGCWCCSFR